jgi:hypothetical protein
VKSSNRALWFFLMMAIGVGVGLYIGWFDKPRGPSTGAAPTGMRQDYRTDYVLMVAETFQSDASVPLAVSRLSFLGNTPAVRLVQEAIVDGREMNYTQTDIELLARLYQALQNPSNPTPGVRK